jgi:hypothetical protein
MEYLEEQREELLQQAGITMVKLKYCSKLFFYHTLQSVGIPRRRD